MVLSHLPARPASDRLLFTVAMDWPSPKFLAIFHCAVGHSLSTSWLLIDGKDANLIQIERGFV